MQHKSLAPSQKLGTGLADIHLIGQITGAVGLGHHPLYCTWQLVYDSHLWAVTNGLTVGRTHASSPELPEDGGLSGVVWDTPLDLALTTSSIQHWPSIIFKLFQRDVWLGRWATFGTVTQTGNIVNTIVWYPTHAGDNHFDATHTPGRS
eukprot:GHRR01035902.1.p1 GENE.GHRR01035902.1~~GHRR01035902.1.p1  ORF type:complete len:149 (+),score=37.70 GHRR01035902.1:587-1033(+)